MTLSMDKTVNEKYDKLETQTKSLFTRSYNKSHKNDTVGKKIGGKKGGAKTVKDDEEDIDGDEDLDTSLLLGEEEIIEIKKAK